MPGMWPSIVGIFMGSESQGKGSFSQGVFRRAAGQSGARQESDNSAVIRPHCPSKGPQPCPRCGSIRALMKAAKAEKMGISSIMEARV